MSTAPLLASERVHLAYWWRHRRALHLHDPRLFTEWVQHRKLFDHDPQWPVLLDKVLVKALVTAQLGPEWIIPTLWHGDALPSITSWPTPLVVKARGGCGQVAFVRDPDDWPAARRQALRWTRAPYGRWLDEWAYGQVPRGLLVEPYVGAELVLPIDYKCFVFGGRVEFVQVHLERADAHRWIMMDRHWRRVSLPTDDPDPVAPATLDRIIAAAETLAGSHSFLRADFYEVEGVPLFGELTVYPGSGLLPIAPPSLDRRMGEHWRAARRCNDPHPAAVDGRAAARLASGLAPEVELQALCHKRMAAVMPHTRGAPSC